MSQQMHFPPQPGQGPMPPAPPTAARNGLGIASLVLGVIGVLAGFIPILFWLSGILGLIALILGLSGRGRVKRGQATNKGVALAGTILGALSLVLAVVGVIITVVAVNDVVDALNEEAKSVSSSAGAGSDGDDAAKDGADGGSGKDAGDSGPLEAGDSAVYDGDLWITVSEPKGYTPSEWAVGHTAGNSAYQVTVVIENKGKKKFDSALLTVEARAGEDGVEAEQIFDDQSEGLFTGSVQPGKKVSVVFAFDAPADAKSLDVEVSPGFTYESSSWALKL